MKYDHLCRPIPKTVWLVKASHAIFLPFLDQGMINVLQEISLRTPYFLKNSKYTFVRLHFFDPSMSLYIDMKMIRSLSCSGWILFSALVLWISRSNSSVECPGKTVHSNSADSPSIPSNSRYSQLFVNHSLFTSRLLLNGNGNGFSWRSQGYD